MEIEIDVSVDDRTPEQNAKLERYYQANKILKAAGFNSRVIKYVVTKSTDQPACIELK